jgi:hypothetical protein
MAGDTGEEVLVAARDADDLMRQDRTDDDRDVVLDNLSLIEQHRRRRSDNRPSDSSSMRAAGMVPRSMKVESSHHSWLSKRQRRG